MFDRQMIVMLGAGVPQVDQAAQAVASAQLREDERNEMVPAVESLIVGVALMTIHNRLKDAAIDRFKNLTENARENRMPRLVF